MNNKKETLKALKEDSLINTILNIKPYLSKKKIKQYLKYNMVEVNNKVVTNANYQIKQNDKIIIYYERKIIKENAIEILYEDDDIIVITKPSGLL